MDEFNRKFREYKASDSYNTFKGYGDNQIRTLEGVQDIVGAPVHVGNINTIKNDVQGAQIKDWQDYKNSVIDKSDSGNDRYNLVKKGKMVTDDGSIVDIDYDYYSQFDDDTLKNVFGEDGAIAFKYNAVERKRKGENSSKKEPSESNKDDDGEWIEYTYKPGDTFGQVILDQGLATNHGLWGADGDVAYYNQYLDPSKMASYGIPVGTTIRLKKRK